MIFRLNAPQYWDRNIPVIPLHKRTKRPVLLGWTAYADKMPPEDVREAWLAENGDGNIGLPLGPQSGMVALDIDTEDPKLQRIIESVLPHSPWRRIGRKGAVLMFRYSGQRTFRIKTAKTDKEESKTICELLSRGAQVVLPPSIHPDTELPYTANCDLLDVIDQLPILPRDIESILRGALHDAEVELSHQGWTKISEFVPAGSRDNAMVAHAGILARAVVRGERTLVEALDEISQWVIDFTENVAGDPLDPEKGRAAVIRFLTRDVMGEKRRALPRGWDVGLSEEDKQKLGFGEEHEIWDYERMKKHLLDIFEITDKDSPARGEAIEFVLNRLGANTSISPIDEDRLLRYIVDSSARTIGLSALRQRLREYRQGEISGTDHSEIARAVLREISQYGDIRYHASKFWQWRGASWEEYEENNIARLISDEYGTYLAARRRSDHRGILETVKILAEAQICTSHRTGVNFANGFLTQDLQLLPHDPSYGMTYVLPYRYMPELAGKMPLFMDFLQHAWGDEEDFDDRVQALREAYAVSLFGLGPYFNRAICLYGMPKSGKSQMVKILQGLMPDGCATAVSPHDWGDKFMPTALHGKLINLAGELSENRLVDGEKFKLIVEGGEIMGQYKGEQVFKFRPTCTHWFATNHLPHTRDTSDGFNRRWLFLDFNNPVSAENRKIDIYLPILADEREAIAAWAVQALPDLIKKADFTLPECHMRCVDEVANQNNSVRFFLKASGRVRLAPSDSIPTRITENKLHDAYWDFCLNTALVKPVSLKTFRLRMRELQKLIGFSMDVGINEAGMEEVVYSNLTLVEQRRAA